MTDYDFVGIDIAKAKFDVFLQTEGSGKNQVFENNQKGFKQFESWLKKHTHQAWICLEATGRYGEALAEFMIERKVMVSIVNPMQIRNFSKSILSRNKNDALDAKVIAHYAKSASPLRPYKPRTKAEKALKETVQLMQTLETQRRQLRHQMNENVSCGNVKLEFRKMICSMDTRIAALEKKLKNIMEQNKAFSTAKSQLQSIVGIGEKTAHRLIAYLPDLSLFENAKQLAAYAGLSPKQCQSGKMIGKTKISKIGNARLRQTLYMPALVVKNHNQHFSAFCNRLEKNGLKPKAIVCAVMRKLLHIIFGMFKSEQEFNANLV